MKTFKNLVDLAEEMSLIYRAILDSQRSLRNGGSVTITRDQISERGLAALNSTLALAFETQDPLLQAKVIAFHSEHLTILSDLLGYLGPAFSEPPPVQTSVEKSITTPDGFMIR